MRSALLALALFGCQIDGRRCDGCNDCESVYERALRERASDSERWTKERLEELERRVKELVERCGSGR